MSTIKQHKPRALTAKQAVFVSEYLIDLNATQAAIRAGFSKKTAYSQGQRLLKNVEVKAVIDAELDRRAERTRVDADRVIKELARIGFLDIRSLVDISPDSISLKYGEDMCADDAAAIAEVSETKDGIKIKCHSKLAALQLLARHTGVIKDTREDGQEPDSDLNNFEQALDSATAEAFGDEEDPETI